MRWSDSLPAGRRVVVMSSVKRSAAFDLATAPAAKKQHPFFAGPVKQPGNFLPSPSSLIHFLHLDPFAQPAPWKVPIVFYDLDGTLIKTRKGGRFPASRHDWAWWHPSVLAKLQAEHDEGKHIIVISNQGDAREKIRSEWKAKLPLVVSKLPPELPIRVLAALSKVDVYRKPNIGMFQVVQSLYREKGYEIDLENSVFVGDAAGRLAKAKQQFRDHSDTDLKWALNVGVDFLTPEEYFLGDEKPEYPIPPVGFKPSKLAVLATLPPVVPSNTPIARHVLEIVLFIGPPASGKTSFFRRQFSPLYTHINQDVLRTRDKCLATADESLRHGKSVVIDATNRNRDTRSHWISLAAKLKVPIRAFHFLCPVALARHNNIYRACYAPADVDVRTVLPGSAFATYEAMFEPPLKSEGFDEVKAVNFIFEGSREEREKWDMYMLEVK